MITLRQKITTYAYTYIDRQATLLARLPTYVVASSCKEIPLFALHFIQAHLTCFLVLASPASIRSIFNGIVLLLRVQLIRKGPVLVMYTTWNIWVSLRSYHL
jgi:hypothetical protein